MTFRKITSWYILGTQKISCGGLKKLEAVMSIILQLYRLAQGGYIICRQD